MITKCPTCRAPIGYTESGEMRFDSSQYHMDAAKKLSQIAAWKAQAMALEAVLKDARDWIGREVRASEEELPDAEDIIRRTNEILPND